MSEVLISVIVPVYNVEKYLKNCLDSIVNQTYRHLEIICINDGSTDASLEILEAYAAKDERITVLSQPNSGQSYARNRGISLAHGTYISFIDSDDFIDEAFYENLCAAAEDSQADVVQCGYHNWQQNKMQPHGVESRSMTFFMDIIKSLDDCFVWSKLWRKDFIVRNKLKFYPGIYYEDVLFVVEAASKAALWKTIDYCGYFYRINPLSSVNNPLKEAKRQNDSYFAVKKLLEFIKNENLETAAFREFENFIIRQLVWLNYLHKRSYYLKYKKLFGDNKFLQKQRKKALRRWFFHFSAKNKELVICGKKFLQKNV